MKRVLSFAVLGLIIGLVAGYFIFGTILGQRVGLDTLLNFGPQEGLLGGLNQAANEITGLSEIRRNIVLTGAVGGIAAGLTAMLTGAGGRRRRRRR